MPIRYHLHPETGEPGKCRATKQCPFGDIETEHYNTQREARAAFEERMKERVLAAHSRELTPSEARIQQLLEEKRDMLPQGNQRALMSSVLARYAEADTPIKKGFLQWSLEQSVDDYEQLKREDLREVCQWMKDAFAYGQHAEWYRRQSKALDAQERRYRDRLNTAKRDLKKHLAEGDEVEAGYDREEAERYRKYLLEVEAQRKELASGEGLRKAQESDEQFAKDLLKKRFLGRKSRLADGDKVFDGVNEFTFLTPDGEEHTVREELSKADYKYAGKMSIAQGEALKLVQEQGQVLVGLLSDEEGFHFPQEAPGSMREPTEEQLAEAFPPREGFRLLTAGGENNVYIHEPTQMLYKVPHTGSLMFPEGVEDEAARKRVLSRAVYLVESRYAEVEDTLEEVHASGAPNVDYLKTYFVNAVDGKGQSIPLVVQPKLDMEVHRPLIAGMVEIQEEKRTTSLYGKLQTYGFTDLHDGNVFYNTKTQRAVMLDCLFVPTHEREMDYRNQGLLEGGRPEPGYREEDYNSGSNLNSSNWF